jgi:uncharacterized membrane-anchored protein
MWIKITAAALFAFSAFAQEEPAIEEDPFGFQYGPVTGRMADISTIKLPEGYAFTGPEGTQKFMTFNENIVSGTEIGTIISSNEWFAVFDFDGIGYVKDNEKDDLDADALLKSMREGEIQANKQRREMGMEELNLVGWYKEPFYNDQTQNLEWCTEIRSSRSPNTFANHNIRILGRYGVTRITLVANIDQLDTAIPELAALLDSYEYTNGKKYAEYRQGDKIAKYGLTALVAGGAAAVALKTGLFKYIWKGLVFVGIAVAGFFKKIFKRDK